jgi:hypothetical protein
MPAPSAAVVSTQASPPSLPLAPPTELASSVPPTLSAITQTDMAVGQLERLPPLSSPQVPSLQGDLQTAKTNALLWPDTLRARTVAALKGISAWSTTFDSLYGQLLPLVTRIGQGDASAIDPFKALLGQLQQQTQQQALVTAQLKPDLMRFESTVDGDVRNLTGDQQQLQSIMRGQQAQMQQLQGQISDLQSRIDAKKKEEATLGMFSPLAWLIAKLIDSLTGQLDGLEGQRNNLQSQLNQTQQQYQSTQQISASVGQYQQAVGSISSGISSIAQGWDVLDASFSELMEDENIQSFNAFTPALLETVRSDWEVLAQQVSQLQ